VKSASELLDRLIKDIITEGGKVDLDRLVPLLRERIYVKNRMRAQRVPLSVSACLSVCTCRFVSICVTRLFAASVRGWMGAGVRASVYAPRTRGGGGGEETGADVAVCGT
jgi:hypothetical protein